MESLPSPKKNQQFNGFKLLQAIKNVAELMEIELGNVKFQRIIFSLAKLALKSTIAEKLVKLSLSFYPISQKML